VIREVMKNNSNYFGLTPEVAESIAKSKDLGKGGSNFPDPLIVFRNKGLFTKEELEKIDDIIERNPFDDVKVIANKVSEYVQSIRPDGFAEGGRIGYRSGKSVKGIAELLKLTNKKFGKDTLKVADEIERPGSIEDFERLTQKLDDLPPPGSRGGSDDIAAPFQSADDYRQSLQIEVNKLSIEELTPEALKIKYPGITDDLAELIGNDTNLQRKAEALASIEQAMALKGAGKSADETIEILKRESKTKMSKGGLARILEM